MIDEMTPEDLRAWATEYLASAAPAPEMDDGSRCDCTECQVAHAVLALLDEPGPCAWTEDEDYNWTTTCGHPWCLNEGRPSDNGMVYCPMCGRKLLEQRYVVPLDEEA